MHIPRLSILSAAVLATTAHGLAINGTTLLVKPGDNSDPQICTLDPYDPSSWSRGGGDVLVEGWLQEQNWDEHDWLRELDANSTGTGGGNSNLDCKNLYAQGTCTAPTQQCKFFTPYSFYYVCQMAANFNQYMTWARELLQDYTISNNLKIDEMVKDLSTKRLVGNLFTAWHVVVLAARMTNPDKYCKNYGNRYINGYCYMLYYINDSKHLAAVDWHVLENLEFKYGIDPAALYANVDACDNGSAEGSNGLALSTGSNGYTPCFFNMAIVKAQGVDCPKWNNNWPSWFRNAVGGLTCLKGTV